MRSLVSASQLPNGTLCRTHSTLFTCHDRLVGCSIQVVYDTIAHASRTRKGATINTVRRRRRLRLTAGPPGRSPRAAPPARNAGTGGESAASGRALTPESEPDRRRPLIPSRQSLDRVRQDNENDTQHPPAIHAGTGLTCTRTASSPHARPGVTTGHGKSAGSSMPLPARAADVTGTPRGGRRALAPSTSVGDHRADRGHEPALEALTGCGHGRHRHS
jgi:hypothetical protein